MLTQYCVSRTNILVLDSITNVLESKDGERAAFSRTQPVRDGRPTSLTQVGDNMTKEVRRVSSE